VSRFLQADSYRASGGVDDPQSWNRYSYTRNNPVNRVDPSGLQDRPPPPTSGTIVIVPFWSGCELFPEACGGSRQPFADGGSGRDGLQRPERPEIRLKQIQVIDTVKTFDFGSTTVRFDFTDSIVCDELEFSLTLSLAIFPGNAAWRVIGIDYVGELVQIGTTQAVNINEFGKEVRLRLRWDNKDENFERRSEIKIKIEATRSNVYGQTRETTNARIIMTCRN